MTGSYAFNGHDQKVYQWGRLSGQDFLARKSTSEIEVDFLASEVDFLASEVDFLASEVDFLASEVDFLASEVDFLARQSWPESLPHFSR